MAIVSAIIGAIVGALAGALTTLGIQKRQADREYSALIIAFAIEAVHGFARCVKTYEHYSKLKTSGQYEASFGAIFSFTDATIFSKFASVTDKPEVVSAIVDLKDRYFQVGRHMEEVSMLASEADSLKRKKDPKTEERFEETRRAQERTLSFFGNSYEKIKNQTAIILNAAKNIVPGKETTELSDQFTKAILKKADIDEKMKE